MNDTSSDGAYPVNPGFPFSSNYPVAHKSSDEVIMADDLQEDPFARVKRLETGIALDR